jgi:hypothetical protein
MFALLTRWCRPTVAFHALRGTAHAPLLTLTGRLPWRSFMNAAGFEGVATVLDARQEDISDGAQNTSSGSGGSSSGGAPGQGAADPFYWVVGYRGLGEAQGGPSTPSKMARDFVPPALLELDLQ